MKRIGILATGMSEIRGLPGALQRLFGHDFFPITERPDKPFNSFTSDRITNPTSAAPENVLKVVQRVAAELDTANADFVVIVDDLELVNLARIAPVLEHMRQAVNAHLTALRIKDKIVAETLTKAFRERVSFHLAVPMLEAWFFADLETLRPLALNKTPELAPGGDPEAFETADGAFASEDGSACRPWEHLTSYKRKLHKPTWMCADRTHHPKAYLAWLMKDPSEKGCSRYSETDHAVRALENLDWPATLRVPEHCNYLRALIEDLSIALNEPLPWLDDPETPVPTRFVRGSRVLRNL